MVVTPPLIVGLNHPSGDYRRALWPDPPGCAGWRLWLMVHDACGISQEEWVRGTRRANLLDVPQLPGDYRAAALRRGRLLAGWTPGQVTVLLGREVARAFDHSAPNFVWDGRRVSIPHPSGRCREYNDPAVFAAAGVLLADVLYACGVYPPPTTP